MTDWIRVEDRLPEPGYQVIVLIPSDWADAGYFCELDYFDKWEPLTYPDFSKNRYVGKVSHWMPLPKPPEK